MLTIIPARSGSKGVSNKNILKLHSKSLSQWSVDFAANLIKQNLAEKSCLFF